VLEIATTATVRTGEWTRWCDSVWSGGFDLHGISAQELLSQRRDFSDHHLAWQSVPHEDDLSLVSRNAMSTMGDRSDLESNSISDHGCQLSRHRANDTSLPGGCRVLL